MAIPWAQLSGWACGLEGEIVRISGPLLTAFNPVGIGERRRRVELESGRACNYDRVPRWDNIEALQSADARARERQDRSEANEPVSAGPVVWQDYPIVIGGANEPLTLEGPVCSGDATKICCELPAYGQAVVVEGRLVNDGSGWRLSQPEVCELAVDPE